MEAWGCRIVAEGGGEAEALFGSLDLAEPSSGRNPETFRLSPVFPSPVFPGLLQRAVVGPKNCLAR